MSCIATLIALFAFSFLKGHFTDTHAIASRLPTLTIGGIAEAAAYGVARTIMCAFGRRYHRYLHQLIGNVLTKSRLGDRRRRVESRRDTRLKNSRSSTDRVGKFSGDHDASVIVSRVGFMAT